MIQLRPYQGDLIERVRDAIRRKVRNILAVAPTGSGKTVMASTIAKGCEDRGKASWFLVHRDFLLSQTALTFDQFGIDYGFIAPGEKMKDRAVQIGMIDTVKNRLGKLEPPDVAQWDECHHLRAAGWMRTHDWMGPDCIHVGWSATPERLDGKGLNPPFQELLEGPSTADLMDMGALSNYRAFEPSKVDMKAARTVGGDYQIDDVDDAVRKSVIMGDIVGTYLDKAPGMRAVYFCAKIKYSQELAAEFNARGVRAVHMDGETPTKERTRIARQFADGDLDVICNVGLMGEGYDLAAQAGRNVTIDVVGIVRPTKSLAFHRQMIGRCLRPKSYPAIIIDHVGNLQELGAPDTHIDWTLEGRKKNTRELSPKRCRVCSAINPVNALVCFECGAPLASDPTGPRGGPQRVDGELIEVDPDAHKARDERRAKFLRMREEEECTTKEQWIELGKRRGYKAQWALIRWNIYKENMASLEATRR